MIKIAIGITLLLLYLWYFIADWRRDRGAALVGLVAGIVWIGVVIGIASLLDIGAVGAGLLAGLGCFAWIGYREKVGKWR